MGETLYIKNMVCNRCIMTVEDDLRKLGISFGEVRLGEVELCDPLLPPKKLKLSALLNEQGFELLEDKNGALIERIKTLIIEMIHHSGNPPEVKYSVYLSQETGKDYHKLSNLFSAVTGMTIEKFIIAQKIEKIKELLYYDELNISEISYRLGYSSVAHLSNQFKKVTGMTPTKFKALKAMPRKPLDSI